MSLSAGSTSPHETRFVLGLIEGRRTEAKPVRLIGDKAYDSDPLDATCAAMSVAMIAPHRDTRVKPRTQDGRPLRRYRRRWKVERLFAWMQNYRRVAMRYERHFENLLAFLKFVAFMILGKRHL